MVRPAQQGQRSSQAALLAVYYPPLRRYLARRWGLAEDQADDLLQAFVSEKVLERNLLAAADRTKGKFRTFLLTSLANYVIDQFRHTKRFPVPGGLEADACIQDDAASAQEAFERDWARRTVARALESMRAECHAKDRSDVWEVFRTRIVDPILNGWPEVPYEELVTRFGLKSPAAAFNLLVTGKRMFERHLRSVVGVYLSDNSSIDEELADLRRVLSEAGAS
jgi:DNA-directed RNA polymerase specialized sigma24 family protein